MMNIDKLDTTIEKLTEKIKSLPFVFLDPNLQSEANVARDEAVAALESYLELAAEDWDKREESIDEEDTD